VLVRRADVRRPAVRPALARFALLGVRFAVVGRFDPLVLAGARFVEPERAGLDRFTFPLDLDAPPLRPPPLRC